MPGQLLEDLSLRLMEVVEASGTIRAVGQRLREAPASVAKIHQRWLRSRLRFTHEFGGPDVAVLHQWAVSYWMHRRAYLSRVPMLPCPLGFQAHNLANILCR